MSNRKKIGTTQKGLIVSSLQACTEDKAQEGRSVMTYVILRTNLGQKVKNTFSYAKNHEESKKILPQI